MTMAMAMAEWASAPAIMAGAIMTPITAPAIMAAAMAGIMTSIIRAPDIMSMTAADGGTAGPTASGAIGRRGGMTGAMTGGETGIATVDPDGVAIAMVGPATGSDPTVMAAPIAMAGRAIMSDRALAVMTAAGTDVDVGMAGADAMARMRSAHRPSPAPRQVSPALSAA